MACSICLNDYNDPISAHKRTNIEHIFCRACISDCKNCPLCRLQLDYDEFEKADLKCKFCGELGTKTHSKYMCRKREVKCPIPLCNCLIKMEYLQHHLSGHLDFKYDVYYGKTFKFKIGIYECCVDYDNGVVFYYNGKGFSIENFNYTIHSKKNGEYVLLAEIVVDDTCKICRGTKPGSDIDENKLNERSSSSIFNVCVPYFVKMYIN